MTPLNFLELLWQHKPEDLHILIWTLQDKRSHWYQDVAQAAEFVQQTRDTDLYVGVGLASRDHGATHRCGSEEIAGIAGFWADLDLKSAAHPKSLPTTVEEALTIIPTLFPPTIVVATGNGLHAWWLFKEPYCFASDEERTNAAGLGNRWQTLLQLKASQQGWAFERLSDLARVLRIAGTQNHKDQDDPKEVVVHSHSGRRYNLSDFEEYLDYCGVRDQDEVQRVAAEWKQRFADKPLVINLNARIPDETLNRWIEQDMRFRHTWYRQRHDLKDQSQSGYDMSLACFGTDNGLDEQQIIDLIVHHRASHKCKPCTRLDYFHRTISKAARASEASDPLLRNSAPARNGPKGSSAGSAPDQSGSADENAHMDGVNAPDPTILKAQVWDQISQILGIRIYRLVKIAGKNPLYRMELEGGKIELSNVGKLAKQDSLRNSIAGLTNKFFNTQKPKSWEKITQMMLGALTEEGGGDELGLEGSARLLVAQYLSATQCIDSVEGQPDCNAHRPLIHQGQVTVCATDLQIYINKTTIERISVIACAGMLSVLNAKNFRLRGNFREQSRWALPSNEFHPADYSKQHKEDRAYADE